MQDKNYIIQNGDDELCKELSDKGISFKKIPSRLDTDAIHKLSDQTDSVLVCDLACLKKIMGRHDIRYKVIINDYSEVIEFFNRLLVSTDSLIAEPGRTTSLFWQPFVGNRFAYFRDIRKKLLTMDIEAWTDGVCGSFMAEHYPNIKFKFKEHQVFSQYNTHGHFKHGEGTLPDEKDRLFFYTINLRKERLARYKLMDALESSGLKQDSLSLTGSHYSLDSIKNSMRKDLKDSYSEDELEGVNWYDGMPKKSFYRRTYFELACETLGNADGDDTFWPTEKTMKPILMKHPFMVLAPMHHLRNLRELGFRTFGNVIDESFDQMPKIEDRIKKIIQNIQTIKHDPLGFWNATNDIREHNHSVLENLLEKDRKSTIPYQRLV